MTQRVKRRMSPQRFYMITRKYKVVETEWRILHKHQDARCAICLTPEEELNTHHLYLDHDHATGKPRGLLCARCNTLLGTACDSIELLQRAIDYLKTPYWNEVLRQHDPVLAAEAEIRQQELLLELTRVGELKLREASFITSTPKQLEELRKQLLIDRARKLGLIP